MTIAQAKAREQEFHFGRPLKVIDWKRTKTQDGDEVLHFVYEWKDDLQYQTRYAVYVNNEPAMSGIVRSRVVRQEP